MLSLVQTCRFPFATFVTMRGQWHEFNPWQNPMGKATEPVLDAAGCLVETVDDPADVGAQADATLHRAFVGGHAAALLLHQRLVPVKTFGK
jgi:sulfopyruvate decarboxylase TPP-binding subunit